MGIDGVEEKTSTLKQLREFCDHRSTSKTPTRKPTRYVAATIRAAARRERSNATGFYTGRINREKKDRGELSWLVAAASTPPAPRLVWDRIHGRGRPPYWFLRVTFLTSPLPRLTWKGLLHIMIDRRRESRGVFGGKHARWRGGWTVTNSLGIVQSDRKRDPEIPQSNTHSRFGP